MKAMVIVVAVETEIAVSGNASDSDNADRNDDSVFGESRGDGGVCSTGQVAHEWIVQYPVSTR